MRLTLTLLVFFLSLGLVSKAQSSFDPKISLRNASVSQLSAKTGLVSNNLTDVCQSSDGLIWITSYNGFMVYDGERIEVYDKNRLSFLSTNGFNAIVEGDDNKIYLASQGSGAIVYDQKDFFELDSLGGVLPKGIMSMYYSVNKNRMYFGSNNEGVYQMIDGVISKVNIPQFSNASILKITEDEYGTLWVGSDGNGLISIHEGLIKHYDTSNGLLGNVISSLATDNEGHLLIGTTKGLQLFSYDTGISVVKELKDSYINCLLVDDNNSVWVGTELGVYRWNKSVGNIDSIKLIRNIDIVRVSSIIEDHEGSIWISSNRSGLLQFKESNIHNWSEPYIKSDRVYKVHESWTGDFYIGSDENSIDVISGDENKTLNIKTNLLGNGVRDIYHDTDSSLWLATYIGIIHIKNGVETVYSTEDGLLANNFRVIYKDSSGNFWFGSRSGGLVKMRDGEIIDIYSNENELTSNFIFSIKEDNQGNIFVGSYSGGFSVIKPNGEAEIFYLKNNDSVVLLFNIDVFSDNTAIIMSNTGPLYFDGNIIKPIHLKKSIRGYTCFDTVIDNDDHIWITSNVGVMRIDYSEWQKYIENDETELDYSLFDENNGMNNKECIGATSATLASNGSIYIPTLGGVCILDPKNIKQNEVKPKITIRKVLVDQKDYLKAENKEIPAGSLRFIFEFSALSYNASEKNKYKYKLEGLDEDWSKETYDGKVEYTNLRPGIYTFRVIGSNDSETWNNDGASFKFRVNSRFYETFWFFIISMSLLALLLFLAYKWRTSFINKQNKQLKKVNSELDRFVYSTSHEMRSPLSSILGLVNIARSDQSNIVEYLDHIEDSVLGLDAFIHDLIDFSKNARLDLQLVSIDLEKLIFELYQDISFSSDYTSIDFQVNNDKDGLLLSDYDRVKIVLSNLLNNAFKHHDPKNVGKPYVHVYILRNSNGVSIEVKDNGPGIKEQHKNKIFSMFYRGSSKTDGSGLGLYMVEEIVPKLKGTLEVVSKEQEGTNFKLYLPNL